MLKNNKILLFLVLCGLTGCGKKRRNFFDTQSVKKIKVNQLSLPSVTGLTIEQKEAQTELSWQPIDHEHLIGYNIYRFAPDHFIPKKPCSSLPLTTTTYTDYTQPEETLLYCVRGVFELPEKQQEGPSSKLVRKNPL